MANWGASEFIERDPSRFVTRPHASPRSHRRAITIALRPGVHFRPEQARVPDCVWRRVKISCSWTLPRPRSRISKVGSHASRSFLPDTRGSRSNCRCAFPSGKVGENVVYASATFPRHLEIRFLKNELCSFLFISDVARRGYPFLLSAFSDLGTISCLPITRGSRFPRLPIQFTFSRLLKSDRNEVQAAYIHRAI